MIVYVQYHKTFKEKNFKFSWYLNFFGWHSWSHRKLHASVAVPAALVRVPSQRLLVTSFDPEGCGQISWHLPYCWGKPQLMGAARSVIASNGVPYLKIKSVGSYSKSGRERKGKIWYLNLNGIMVCILAGMKVFEGSIPNSSWNLHLEALI